jgi:hypothetical protein
MQQPNKSILIGVGDFAGFLGVSVRRIFRHGPAMRAAGAMEEHSYRGRLYSVTLPDELNRDWRQRRFD